MVSRLRTRTQIDIIGLYLHEQRNNVQETLQEMARPQKHQSID